MAIIPVNNVQKIISLLGLPGATTVTYSGDAQALAVGNPSLAHFPSKLFADFLVMSTGVASQITGANTSGSQGTDLGLVGESGDTATLTLNIPVPLTKGGTLANGIAFDFTFLSEEYPEFVGSAFNDFFSIKVNGTEIAKDTSGKPITVNNNFFTGALTPTGTFFDGQTPPLHIQSQLPAGATTVTLQMQIGDVGDGIFDSAAFLNNLSFTSSQVVYVAFGGGTATYDHGPTKGQNITLPGLDPAFATAAYQKSVIDSLNSIYSKYNISFTSTKPSSGEFSTVLVGGAGAYAKVPAALGVGATTTGQAEEIDVGNKDHSDLAIILTEHFSGEATKPSAASLSQTIGHEVGHLLGLYHVQDSSQIMYYAKNTSTAIGGATDIKGITGKQDSNLELTNSLGVKNGATLADTSKTAAQSLMKQGILGFNNNQVSLYDAQLGVITNDGDDQTAVYIDLGKIAPNSIKPFELPMDGNSQVIFMAKLFEDGTYDVFSSGGTSSGQVNDNSSQILLPTGGGTFSFGSSEAKLDFGLVKVSGGTASSLGNVSGQISSTPVYADPLKVSDLNSKPPSETLAHLVDFDGVNLGSAGSWKIKAEVDIQGDGDKEIILFNKDLGRWATLGPDENGVIDLANHSWNGDTRVVGIYIDPLVASNVVPKGSPFDSQARFENDLKIDNIATVLDAGDYNHDGFQEIYFSLTDKTAVLHSIMHLDGNIQYANYQNSQQLGDYLSANGYNSTYYHDWLA